MLASKTRNTVGQNRGQVCVVGHEGHGGKLHTGTFRSTRTRVLPVRTSQPWDGHRGPEAPFPGDGRQPQRQAVLEEVRAFVLGSTNGRHVSSSGELI